MATGNKASRSPGGAPTADTSESVPVPAKTARERCYEAIMADMKAGIARYYSEHSDRLGDSRSGDAVAWSTRGIRRILQILEQYDIQDLPRGSGKSTPSPAAVKEQP